MSILQNQLREVIKVAFKNVVRKDGESYINHLDRVAANSQTIVNYGYEIGLCHDLLEDTNITEQEFHNILLEIGYDIPTAEFIVSAVVELTNVFTKEMFPNDNRQVRSTLETYRLAITSPQAQTVKLFDIIDNITDIKNMGGFARKYLNEKKKQVLFLQAGYDSAKRLAKTRLLQAEKELGKL